MMLLPRKERASSGLLLQDKSDWNVMGKGDVTIETTDRQAKRYEGWVEGRVNSI